jgi:pyochelin biosynthetic protein PchC
MPASSVSGDLWLRRFGPAPDARARLICMPHAGGSASYYFPVAQALVPAVDVLAVQYPGRQDRYREPCIETIPALADLVAPAVADWADRPLTLFGHSMGATLAFEVALRLQAAGVEVSALFASGRRAPSRIRNEYVHLRDDEGLLAEIRSLDGTEAHALGDQDVVDMVLPAIRSDYRAAETYRYESGPKLRAPIFALVGNSDPKATVDEVRSWADHTDGRFELRVFPGGHFYLNTRASEVIEMIARHIGGAVGATSI